MEARTTLRYLRMSPRKMRLVADLIRGLRTEKAETELLFSRKHAAKSLLKVLKSAEAVAKEKKMDPQKLFIRSVTVDGGPTLKRWQPRAHGRATPLRKRSSHITIVLEEKSETLNSGAKLATGQANPKFK